MAPARPSTATGPCWRGWREPFVPEDGWPYGLLGLLPAPLPGGPRPLRRRRRCQPRAHPGARRGGRGGRRRPLDDVLHAARAAPARRGRRSRRGPPVVRHAGRLRRRLPPLSTFPSCSSSRPGRDPTGRPGVPCPALLAAAVARVLQRPIPNFLKAYSLVRRHLDRTDLRAQPRSHRRPHGLRHLLGRRHLHPPPDHRRRPRGRVRSRHRRHARLRRGRPAGGGHGGQGRPGRGPARHRLQVGA